MKKKNLSSFPKIIPKIVIDARMIFEIPHGISRYVSLLIKSLKLLHEEQSLPYTPIFLSSLKKNRAFFSPFESVFTEIPFLHFTECIQIPYLLKKLQADLYHSPSFSSLVKSPCPSIVTLHDLNHLKYGNFIQKLYYKTLLRRFALHSCAIISISEFSRNEISEWLNIPCKRITLVPNTIECDLKNQVKISSSIFEKYQLKPKKYFFCLSHSKPHKNLPLLIHSYQLFQKQQENPWPLVLSTHLPTPIKGVICIGPQQETDIHQLLTHAGGGLFPSLYEGFGLAPVEAAVLGCPLAVSNIPPHLEGLIDLDAHEVLWIKPYDLHGWANAFHRFTKQEIAPPSLENRKKILTRFNIRKMGHKMNEIYTYCTKGKKI